MKVLILYGSSRGRTRAVAQTLFSLLRVREGFASIELIDVKEGFTDLNWSSYEGFIFGSSTWDRGDLQRDFYRAEKELEKLDLLGKWTAIFSCASILYPYYAESLGILENLAERMNLKRIVPSLVIDDLDKDLLAKLEPWCSALQIKLK